MKIRVVHKETEICVQDNTSNDTNYNLVYYNQDYILKLIKEITENIIKLKYESEKS
jgi:hypothetical protein